MSKTDQSTAVRTTDRFEALPQELKVRPRWVVWQYQKQRKKCPHCPDTGRPVNITLDSAGTDHERAVGSWLSNPSFDGVGVILDGDGLVGVDLDHCFINGQPDPRALELLHTLNCGYVEVSPSGQGLRAFGRSDQVFSGIKTEVDGIAVEVYATKRYMTVTGEFLQGHGFTGQLQDFTKLFDLLDLRQLPEATQETQEIQETHEIQENQASGIHPVDVHINDLPSSCIPTQVGQRNKTIFELARFLRGTKPGVYVEQFYPVVKNWFEAFKENIGTQDFDETWNDFIYGYDRVEKPYGQTLATIRESQTELPSSLLDHGLGQKANDVLTLCYQLQVHHGGPFFLSSRIAGDEVDICHQYAAKILANLCSAGILERLTTGKRDRASEYMILSLED